jgi:hypothetical protein
MMHLHQNPSPNNYINALRTHCYSGEKYTCRIGHFSIAVIELLNYFVTGIFIHNFEVICYKLFVICNYSSKICVASN